ncbi:MAG: hypothetical protein AAGB26_10220 [Planctomycetota bacterium]
MKTLSYKVMLLAWVFVFQASMHCLAAPQPPQDDVVTKPVRYADFGAVGDGKTDDFAAIAKAHAYANKHGRSVEADDKATYYIGGAAKTVAIQTSTDFGKARFVIDDRELEDITKSVFEVQSANVAFRPKGIASLTKGQPRLDVTLPSACVVVVTDDSVRRFIRRGLNVNSGKPQTDVFIVGPSGKVDPDTAIIWDFKQITDIVAYPIDTEQLTITGGHFTTIANQASSEYNYHERGIAIRRSNVLVTGLEHHVTGEGETGAPYRGFINIMRCSNVTVRDCVLTGRKTYRTIGRAGKPVSMGSYDINVNRAVNISFINCTQTNDINDRRYWGIMGSNYCKNLVFDGCTLSRFDAHMGVANATIRNSTLGHMGINAIGTGTLLIENTTIQSRRMINLRPDYGSTWQGRFIIRNCIFKPYNGTRQVRPVLIAGSNDGKHDFGYTCYMPESIKIEGLRIEDTNVPGDYEGPAIFGDFNHRFVDEDYEEDFSYIKTKRVRLSGVTTSSGKPIRLSENEVMFRGVQLEQIDGD